MLVALTGRQVAAAATAMMLFLGACADGGETQAGGLVSGVSYSPAGEPESFTMCVGAGDDMTILIDPTRNYGFPLEHLSEHIATAEPVIVDFETVAAGDFVAFRITDSPSEAPEGCAGD